MIYILMNITLILREIPGGVLASFPPPRNAEFFKKDKRSGLTEVSDSDTTLHISLE